MLKATQTLHHNSVKVSNSCLPSIESATNSHNKMVLNPSTNTNERTYKCMKKKNVCPTKVVNQQNLIQSNLKLMSTELPAQNILWHHRNQIQTNICKPCQDENL